MKKYSIDCFEKKGTCLIGHIALPIKKINLRILLRKWRKEEILDNIKIDKTLKAKLEVRYDIHIPISKYDCYFSETL